MFSRGKGTLAERLDDAWECYNNEERTIEDRLLSQNYLTFVLDIQEHHIIKDLNSTLKSLMLEKRVSQRHQS